MIRDDALWTDALPVAVEEPMIAVPSIQELIVDNEITYPSILRSNNLLSCANVYL